MPVQAGACPVVAHGGPWVRVRCGLLHVPQLVLSAVVLGEPAAGLRAELVRLSSPQDRPAPPAGAIEHSILGLRSTP
jgi:hypothetical protein